MPWHCKATGGYNINGTEAHDNAIEIWNLCNSLGWVRESVAAMLGNIGAESTYNPWRWQSDIVLPKGDPRIGTIGGGNTAHAYGLCQQDPAAKYIYRPYAQMQNGFGVNYSDEQGSVNDGYAQIMYLHWICSQNVAGGEWLPDAPAAQGLGMPFEDFISNSRNYTYAQLTRTFFGCYERGTWGDGSRVTWADYWYNFLGNNPPVDPDIPPSTDSQAAWFGVIKALKKQKDQNVLYRKRHKGWWY